MKAKLLDILYPHLISNDPEFMEYVIEDILQCIKEEENDQE